MKSTHTAFAISLALALTGSAFAYSPKDSPKAPAAPTAVAPLPTEVVHPANLPRSFKGGVLMLEFSLDENGHPQDVQVRSPADRSVREQIVKAFKQWKFDPSSSGAAKRYVLPLDVVMRS